MNRRPLGFTLIEVAVALVVLALLLGSILVPLATQVEQKQVSDAQRALDEVREALIGYAVANGHLPCPDKTTAGGAGTANDGDEDVDAGACVTTDGNVPWTTLGTGSTDPWGNRLRYAVTAVFAQRPPLATFGLTTNGTLRVECPAPACGASTILLTTNAPAVVLSHGRNRYGAMNSLSAALNPAPTGTDELENTDGDAIFISRVATTGTATVQEFDDIVTWLSRFTLVSRMSAAGRLQQ